MICAVVQSGKPGAPPAVISRAPWAGRQHPQKSHSDRKLASHAQSEGQSEYNILRSIGSSTHVAAANGPKSGIAREAREGEATICVHKAGSQGEDLCGSPTSA